MPKNAAEKPLRSMTGYGRGASENRSAAAEVELRTVNGKALALKVRLPSDRLELESRVEALLRKGLRRGTVQGSVRVRLLGTAGASIDHALLKEYLREWRRTEKELGLELRDPSLGDLLALPGALQPEPESDGIARAVSRAVDAAVAEAMEELLRSRGREGARLGKELERLLRDLRRALARVEKRLPRARREAEGKLRERIEEAWRRSGVDEPMDLTRELLVILERADVQEEVARLSIHLDRLDALLAAGGPCGRELEFVIQECHREINTLGSKSGDARIAQDVVAMKMAVQQLKEQSANVE